MNSTSVNSFLDRFLAVADTGFGLIQGDVNAVLNALIVISIVLAGAQWALVGEAPMAPFFRKVLFVGLLRLPCEQLGPSRHRDQPIRRDAWSQGGRRLDDHGRSAQSRSRRSDRRRSVRAHRGAGRRA